MRIERYAYENCTAKYALELDEELVQGYNDALRDLYNLPEDFVELTLQDIVAIYKNEPCRSDEVIVSKNYGDQYALCDIVRDWLNDGVWDNYIETVDGDTYDWDDELIED